MEAQARFWAKVDTTGGIFACWPWLGGRNAKGYGSFAIGGRHYMAHRIAMEIATGEPLPPDQIAMHTCDNPPCVNPAHLRPGTVAENQRDMAEKGRAPFRQHPELIRRGERHWFRLHPELAARGSRNGFAKLDEDAVREIRRRWSAGESRTDLAAAFGISPSNLWLVATGRRWKHVA